MAAQAFGAFITHESDPTPLGPALAPIVPRDHITAAAPTEYELSGLKWGQRLNGPQREYSRDSSPIRSLPQTPGELERSQPPTPKRDQAIDALVQSAWNPPMNRWRLASASLAFFLMGINDAATGALIPYLEDEYSIGYAIVSLIFVTNAVGFISMAPVSQMIEARLGRARSLMISMCLLSIGYVAIICTPPFPVVVLAFYFMGCGMALFLAMTNAFIVNLLNGTVILGFCHGLYGVSCPVSTRRDRQG